MCGTPGEYLRPGTREATVLLCALVLALSLLPAQAASGTTPLGGDWTSLIHDYSNSRYQAASTITGSNVGTLALRWTIGTTSSVTSTPVVLLGSVYFADWAGDVYSAAVATGSVNWEVNLGAPISSTPALANGLVYVAGSPTNSTANGPTRVWALSQANGRVVWETTIVAQDNAIWSSPIVYRGMVIVGVSATGAQENDPALKGEVDALNATNGTPIWTFKTMVGTTGGASVWGSVAVDPASKALYFGTGNAFGPGTSNLYAYSIVSINALTGRLNWYHQVYSSSQTGGDDDFGSTPNLFTMQYMGTVHRVVGLGSKDGNYYILDRSTGALLTKVSVSTGSSTGMTGLAGFMNFGNLEVFVPTGLVTPQCCGAVEAFLPSSGTIVWRFVTPEIVIGSVALIPGAVLFGDSGGNLYAVRTTIGRMLFHY